MGSNPNVDAKNILGVDVFLEVRKSRRYVGRLTRHGKGFKFTYDRNYLYHDRALSLGPELPLSKSEFTSTKLFEAFVDRIPSRQNPAYKEYCAMFGISESETDPMILLPTIGRRGPSSFVFEAALADQFSAQQLASFRKKLGLTIREFAVAFDVATATIQKIEAGKATGRDVLKRLELYCLFPEVALFEIKRSRSKLHGKTSERLIEHLKNAP